MLKRFELLESKLDKVDKKLTRIVCPFFKYEKSSKCELFIDEDSILKIKLNCHNHILSVETYFNYFFNNLQVPKKNLCANHTKEIKTIAYCSVCLKDICQNCLCEKHSTHEIQDYSNVKENAEQIKKEYNDFLKKIPILKEIIKQEDNLNKKQKKCLANMIFLYLIKKIIYIDYLQESESGYFSFACISNLNLIRTKPWNIIYENGTNLKDIEKLFKLKKKLKNDYFAEKYNIIQDDSIINQEKIYLKNKSKYITGNDSYFITVSEHIYIYSFENNKLLHTIQEKETKEYIRFHPDYYNLFLASSNKIIKIWEIKTEKCQIKQTVDFDNDIYIQDIQFIPSNKDQILIIDNNFIIIYDLLKSNYKKVFTLKSPIDTFQFSQEGKILGCLDEKQLTFYKLENCNLNIISSIKEDCFLFHLRKIKNYSNYNLIIINSDYIKFFNDILIDKYEKIKLSHKVKNSYYDNEYDYLYLFSNELIIIKISDWSRILQIYNENDLIPLNSSRVNSSLIKGFIYSDEKKKKTLGKYTFYCSKLNNRTDSNKSTEKENEYSLYKISNFQDLNYIYNIIDENEIFKKNYLNIKEIEKEFKDNYKLSISLKKEMAKQELKDFKEEGSLYEQYIQLIKILIKDNVSEDIVEKYLSFLKQNNGQLKGYHNIEPYNKEIKYYSVCFTPEQLSHKFDYYDKKEDEKTQFVSLLNEIVEKTIDENNIDSFLSKYEKIKQNITTFNQPVEFNNKELYFFVSKIILSLEILREKNNKLEHIINIQSAIKMILDKKLFEDENIINNEDRFNKLLLIILRGQNNDITRYNLNSLIEKNYTIEEKEELISKIDKSLFLCNDIIPATVTNIQVDTIDNKYNFDNIILNYQTGKKLEKYELYKEKVLMEYYESKLDFEKIKSFMKKILLSNCIKEAFSFLYEKPYEYPFKTFEDASDFVDNYVKFITLNDKTCKGATNKFTLKTKIFLKKGQVSSSIDINERIFYKCLYTSSLIKTFFHELNHNFDNLYYFHSNGTIPLSTPRKENITEREGGKYFENILFKEKLKKINLKQAIYILNEKNYEKTLFNFRQDFKSPKEVDLIIEGEFKELNEDISNLTKSNINLEDIAMKLDDDDDEFDFDDYIIDADDGDDVLGSCI